MNKVIRIFNENEDAKNIDEALKSILLILSREDEEIEKES